MGLEVLGISCITNFAAGVLPRRWTTTKCWKRRSGFAVSSSRC
jgi:hypothetical protein